MEWYYAKNGQQQGPVPDETIEKLYRDGEIASGDLVWNESMTDWVPIGTLPQFAAVPAPVSEPTTPAPAAPPAEAAPPQDTPPVSNVAPAAGATLTAAAATGATGDKPPTYLWQSIVCLVLCCLPAAVVALIFSLKVEPAYTQGDLAAAQDASKKAKMWCWIAFGLGLVANIIFFIIGVAGAMAESGQIG